MLFCEPCESSAEYALIHAFRVVVHYCTAVDLPVKQHPYRPRIGACSTACVPGVSQARIVTSEFSAQDAQNPLRRKGFWFVAPMGFEPTLPP